MVIKMVKLFLIILHCILLFGCDFFEDVKKYKEEAQYYKEKYEEAKYYKEKAEKELNRTKESYKRMWE